MNYRMMGYFIGRIFLTEAALLLLPVTVALLYGESTVPFLIPGFLLLVLALLLGIKRPKKTALYARDGFAVVALSWIFMSVFGSVPFVISGDIPNWIDAFFETVSGFTTTGASILKEVESLTQSGLFWRSLTHWIGGMGVLVFIMAVLPVSGEGNGMHLLRAEMPGPSAGKLVSRMKDTSKILYGIYFAMTGIEIILLLVGGMPLYDACINAFGSASTGGFSNRNLSIGAYGNVYFEIVIGVFMLLFGVNFNLYYFLLIRRFREFFRSEELKTYLAIVAVSISAIAVNITHLYGSFATALRYSFFQVSSIMTTTGFSTADFNAWPTLSKGILVILMFIGGCAGSTSGGFKVARVVMLVKSSVSDMKKMLHPNAVERVRYEEKPLKEKNMLSVHVYLSVYLVVFIISFLLLTLEGFDLITTFTALMACINNIGPGLEIVGPAGNFSGFSAFGKLLLSFNMLVGRLEIFPMLLLFAPSIWSHRKAKNAA